MKMFVYIMTMFVYTLAGQVVLTNIGTTELDEECDEECSGEALIYLVERMLASFPPHDDLCQLANPDMIGTHARAQAPCRHTTKHGTGARGVQAAC